MRIAKEGSYGVGEVTLPRTPSLVSGVWLLAVGIGQVALWPELPGNADSAGVLMMGVIGLAALLLVLARPVSGTARWVTWSVALPIAFGVGWALYSNHHALTKRLPEALHGTDHRVTIELNALPQSSPAVSRFGSSFVPSTGHKDARFNARVIDAENTELLGQRLRLSWYRIDPKLAPNLTAGSRWALVVRLKQPRGSLNPHTFDYEAWLLQRGIYASGYVRDGDEEPQFIAAGDGIDVLREYVRDRITGGSPGSPVLRHQALIRALLLGDKGGVDTPTRDLLRRTGTAHLLAISGLHVGMVSGIFLLAGGLLGRFFGLLGRGSPLVWAGGAALLAALAYTLLSGAPLSAQRALIMTFVVIAALVHRRRFGSGLAFGLALASVLLLQPLAVLDAGFWLSFIAVGALLLRFRGRGGQGEGVREEELAGAAWTSNFTSRGMRRFGVACVGALRSQWAILIGLLLPSILIFSGVSASGLLLNLVAIPWVGFLILPLVFLGAVFPGPVGNFLWGLADNQLTWLLEFLAYADSRLPGWQSLQLPSAAVLAFAIISCFVLLLPRGFPARGLGWCLVPVVFAGLLPGGWQREAQAFLNVTVLDVGQGLSVVAATEDHRMLFDTGAGSGRGWNAGSSIVAPYLMAEYGAELDLLAVSHGDRDHAGGVSGVLGQLEIGALVAPGWLGERLAGSNRGTPEVPLRTVPQFHCHAGREDSLDELTVQWLWPDSDRVDGEENDHSCVALLVWRGVRILLTGDISSSVEYKLRAAYPDFTPVDLLVAPHHGSRTSSSNALIQWARPGRVVFSAGYRHHFGHPHPDVVSRYRKAGATLFNTAITGAITVAWSTGSSQPQVRCARNTPRFWRSGVTACTGEGASVR
ncbi:DNA internalization-related competence protein ComEC/Rec2 [Microbulbifer mangrovi]|uniref:DNA internalization-related competence protein ComEC/Rec2 n=1 Tax=Microbulbifer mangrovi TaxID=927787 RepID=UPI0009905B4A|nr:DNA internalization-related competence protein ComEC/Rec2 [Microbulbifer mangrovi]